MAQHETETRLGEPVAQGALGPERALYGFDRRDGTPRYGRWEELFPLVLYGGPGGGKTSLLVNYAAQGTYCCGMRALVIDRAGGLQPRRSLAGRLAPLDFALLEPAAIDPDAALRVLARLQGELADRQRGRGGSYPLLFLADELALMQQEWSEAREQILQALQRIALEGKKYRVFWACATQPDRAVSERIDGALGYVRTRVLGGIRDPDLAALVAGPRVVPACTSLATGGYLWLQAGHGNDPRPIVLPSVREECLEQIRCSTLDRYLERFPDLAQRYVQK